MQVVYHSIIAKYKKIKMINLIHMISILNSIFFYTTRGTKQDLIYICFKKNLNQLNLFYI
jgi:hypothetical protein